MPTWAVRLRSLRHSIFYIPCSIFVLIHSNQIKTPGISTGSPLYLQAESLRSVLESNCGSLFRSLVSFEVSFLSKAVHTCKRIVGESLDVHVIRLNNLVETSTC